MQYKHGKQVTAEHIYHINVNVKQALSEYYSEIRFKNQVVEQITPNPHLQITGSMQLKQVKSWH